MAEQEIDQTGHSHLRQPSDNCSSSASTAPRCRPASRSLLTRLQPAGVILFARNIISAEQTYKLLKDCQACVSTPLFTCVDMEGGRVDRFRRRHWPEPFRRRRVRHRRSRAFPQAWPRDRRVLPRSGIQYRLRARCRPRLRRIAGSHEFPRGFIGSQNNRPLCPGIS